MSRHSLKIHISPYGTASTTLESLVNRGSLHRSWLTRFVSRQPLRRGGGLFQFWVAFSNEVDEDFVKTFRERSTPQTRLLVMNEHQSADTLLTHLLGLQIRSAQRLYVADCFGAGKFGAGKSRFMGALLQRLTSALSAQDNSGRVLDARIESGVLRVVSPEFKRLDIPIAQIPALASAPAAGITEFEIDEDGSFIFWPKLDVHLGWEQLEQIVNPEAARKAQQRLRGFNVRYGQAVRRVREQASLKSSDITGISEKQLGRIENGACRLTANAARALAEAHGLEENAYLQKLAEALST